MKKQKVALYARISTNEKKQNIETQLKPLKEFTKKRNWKIHQTYTDKASGNQETRPELKKLMEDAAKRKFDIVLVFRFDRFARSTKQLVQALDNFQSLGIDFVSYQENIDTTTPSGKVMFTMISAFAEFEREIIRERVKAGLERAKAQGKKLGKPSITKEEIESIKKHAKQGISRRKTAEALGIPLSTVQKYSKGVTIF